MSDKLAYKVGESQGFSPQWRLGSRPGFVVSTDLRRSSLGGRLGAPGTPRIAGLAVQVPGDWSPYAAESQEWKAAADYKSRRAPRQAL